MSFNLNEERYICVLIREWMSLEGASGGHLVQGPYASRAS